MQSLEIEKLKKTLKTKDIDSISSSLNRLEAICTENKETNDLLSTIRAGVQNLKQEIDILKNTEPIQTTSCLATSVSCIDLPIRLQKLFSAVDSEFEKNVECSPISKSLTNLEDVIESKINILLNKTQRLR